MCSQTKSQITNVPHIIYTDKLVDIKIGHPLLIFKASQFYSVRGFYNANIDRLIRMYEQTLVLLENTTFISNTQQLQQFIAICPTKKLYIIYDEKKTTFKPCKTNYREIQKHYAKILPIEFEFIWNLVCL